MSTEFHRENRYLVIKCSDLDLIHKDHARIAKSAINEISRQVERCGAPRREYLVIESDWPEYEPTYAAIERRMTGRPSSEFTPGDVEPVGDCGKWAAYIDDKSRRDPRKSPWYERITVLGKTKEDAEQLRGRVLSALNVNPEPVGWDGQGLPPVGTVCEYKHVHEWQKVEVFAVKPNYNGSHTALVTYENGCWVGCAEPSYFRPIRTPEQIAAEKEQAEAHEIQKIIAPHFDNPMGAAFALYREGYRKQVAP